MASEITVQTPDEPPSLTAEVAMILLEILEELHEKRCGGEFLDDPEG
ncbi:hypothetical protein [Saccharopolyspora sp. NPDC002376]